jgi:DNA-binding GntR family transcriptional regulator
MPIEKIQKTTLRQTVFDKLKETIVTAELLPGETVTLRHLAEKFGVSQMPIREALLKLESENVVVTDSNKSMWVNKLTPMEFEEVTWIRLILEPTAAEKACDLRPDSVLDHFKMLVDQLRASINNPRLYLKLNYQLHFGIYDLAKSPVLLQLIDRLWARVGPYLNIQLLGMEQFRDVALPLHQQMYEALVRRDKVKIRYALEEDIKKAADRIRPLLKDYDTFVKKVKANKSDDDNERLPAVISFKK